MVRPAFEEAGPLGRKDFGRADSDNWRSLREEQQLQLQQQQEEEEEGAEPGGNWRIAGSRRDGTSIHTHTHNLYTHTHIYTYIYSQTQT